jgi:hypothetical protein
MEAGFPPAPSSSEVRPMRCQFFLLAVVLGLCLIQCGLEAAPSKGTFTDPKNAGPDFAIQGEYQGETNEGKKVGAQVIALGDGKFRLVGYPGGLPGDGWDTNAKPVSAEGQTENGVLKVSKDGRTATLANGKITITHDDGQTHCDLKKVERKSPTLGAKPSEGAVVLFDGKSADEWRGGKMSSDGFLVAGSETKRKFGDCTLHIEFRTPFQPKDSGQGRGNSGVYLNSMYELQVLDSFGLSGENNECGGFYSIRKPDVNMCYPPLSWQTYDIEFTMARYENGKKTKNARVAVKHNGVTIHDDIELPRGTPGKTAEGPGPAPLFFQDHGNPVVYRNVWVVEKGAK